MKITALLGIAVACALTFAPSGTASRAEATTIAWQLPIDAQYRVVSTIRQRATTTVAEQVSEETLEQSTTRVVTVDSVDEYGTMSLKVTVDAFTLKKTSRAMTLTLNAVRKPDGKLDVRSSVEMPVELIDTKEFQAFFEALGANMLGIEFSIDLSPTGRVLRSSMKGDPFDHLPAISEATHLASRALEMMVSKDDLADAVAAELFVQLPETAVEVEDRWPVAIDWTVSGIAMSGRGTTTFEKLEDPTGKPIAVLSETIEYQIDTTEYQAKLAELMTLLFVQAGADLEVSIELRTEKMDAKSRARFDVEQGFCRSVQWEDMRLPMSGTMSVGPKSVELEMNVLMEGGRSTWMRVVDR